MTTAIESMLQGQCADLERALEALRTCNRNHLAQIARLNALIVTMAEERTAAEATIRRLTAENAELRAGVTEVPY